MKNVGGGRFAMYEDEKCDWCPRVKYDINICINMNVNTFVVQRSSLNQPLHFSDNYQILVVIFDP